MAGVTVYVVKWTWLWYLPSSRLHLLGKWHSWLSSSLYTCADYSQLKCVHGKPERFNLFSIFFYAEMMEIFETIVVFVSMGCGLRSSFYLFTYCLFSILGQLFTLVVRVSTNTTECVCAVASGIAHIYIHLLLSVSDEMGDALTSISSTIVKGLLFIYDTICYIPEYVMRNVPTKVMISSRIKVCIAFVGGTCNFQLYILICSTGHISVSIQYTDDDPHKSVPLLLWFIILVV